MVGLFDVNVLVALLVPEHEHHATAMAWFATEARHGWATCGVTELGVIRVRAQLPPEASPRDRALSSLFRPVFAATKRVSKLGQDQSRGDAD